MTLTGLIVLLIWLLVVAAIAYFVLWLIDVVFNLLTPAGQPQPAKVIQILKVIVIAIAILVVISWLVGLLPPPPHFGRIE